MDAAAVPAHAGQPTCKKYSTAYRHAQTVDDGRVRMKPVNTGSPVATAYLLPSVFKMVWKRMATKQTQRSDSPCRTNAAGPRRNSPLPIDPPSTITPGPTAFSQPRPSSVGGAGSPACFHGSNPD